MGCFLYDLRAPVRARSSVLGDVRRDFALLTILNSRIEAPYRRVVSHHVLGEMGYSSSRADSHIMRSIDRVAALDGETANSGPIIAGLCSQ